jgi:hypothetical protein
MKHFENGLKFETCGPENIKLDKSYLSRQHVKVLVFLKQFQVHDSNFLIAPNETKSID